MQVGHGGLSDAVRKELDRALTAHELVKVRVGAPDRHERAALATAIAEQSDAAVVQQVGKVIVLWRPRPADEDA